ncbi:amino acid ABC transporter substrate-binding protein [Methyloligella solikamskensis]|uniref:Amino acid ABC transporter substrate-binding protein n=1 Tax=Methyloligella solikamskensis TaxID=1177756 RepID=A0ABW3JAT7_9HYPH
MAADASHDNQQVIHIGAAISLSGTFATSGRYVRDGYEFAVETINARGGILVNGEHREIVLTYRDDRSEAGEATTIVENMVRQEGVRFLLGPYSTQLAQAVEPIAERYKLPMLEAGAAGSSLFERGYRYLFGVLTTTEHYMDDVFVVAAEKAAPKLGKPASEIRVGLAVRDDRFSRDLRDEVLSEIRKHDMRLVIDDRLPQDPTDMSMTLDRVKRLEPDIMVISGHEEAALAALDHLHRQRIAVPMLAVTHCHPANIIKAKPGFSEGVFCPMQWHPSVPYRDDVFGSAHDYAEKFSRRYGYPPPNQAAQASAAILVYLRAIEKCDSLDPDKVRETLAALETETFYGPIDFDDGGRNIAKPMLLMQVINGEYVMLAPNKFGRAEPVIQLRPAR